MKRRRKKLFDLFDLNRPTRKRWEFALAVVRTISNVLAFALSFLIFWRVWR